MRRAKRYLCWILSFCLLFGVFTGCAKSEKSVGEALFMLLAECGFENACTLYSCEKLLQSRDGRAFLASLFGDGEPRAAFYGVKDGALALSKKDNGFEIQVYRTGHPSQAKDLANVLCDREALLKSMWNKRYLGEIFDAYLSSASVYTDGCFVFLLATGDNDAILEKLEKYL